MSRRHYTVRFGNPVSLNKPKHYASTCNHVAVPLYRDPRNAAEYAYSLEDRHKNYFVVHAANGLAKIGK